MLQCAVRLMYMVDRNRALTVRIADEELAMLQSLAEADGLTSSDIVRTMIRRAYAERFGTKKPKVKR
jgi:hypothetical protein